MKITVRNKNVTPLSPSLNSKNLGVLPVLSGLVSFLMLLLIARRHGDFLKLEVSMLSSFNFYAQFAARLVRRGKQRPSNLLGDLTSLACKKV